MARRLWRWDPEARKLILWHDEGDKIVVETRFDTEPILRAAHERRTERTGSGFRFRGDGSAQHHVGYIPMPILMRLWKQGKMDAIRAWLKSDEGKRYCTLPAGVRVH